MAAWRLYRDPMIMSIALRGFSSLLVFASGVLLARWLGPATYGEYTLILAFATIAGTPLSAGLPALLTRETARSISAKDYGRVRVLMRFSLLVVVCTLTVLLLATATWHALGQFGKLSSLSVVFIVLLAILLGIERLRTAILRGLGSALISQIPHTIVRPVLLLVILSVLLKFNSEGSLAASISAYASAVVCSVALGAVLLGRALRRQSAAEAGHASSVDGLGRSLSKGWLVTLLPLSILAASQTWVGVADPILLGWLGTLSEVGIYKVALQGIALMVVVQNGVGEVVITRLSKYFAEKQSGLVVRTSDRSLVMSGLASLVAVSAFFCLGSSAVTWIFGTEYTGAATVLCILAVGQLVNALTGPGLTLLVMARRERLGVLAVCLGAVTTLVGAVPLIGAIGAIGMAIASAIGVVVCNVALAVAVKAHVGFDPTVVGTLKRMLRRNG